MYRVKSALIILKILMHIYLATQFPILPDYLRIFREKAERDSSFGQEREISMPCAFRNLCMFFKSYFNKKCRFCYVVLFQVLTCLYITGVFLLLTKN